MSNAQFSSSKSFFLSSRLFPIFSHRKILIFPRFLSLSKLFANFIYQIKISFIFFLFSFDKSKKNSFNFTSNSVHEDVEQEKRHRYFTICWCNQQILSCSLKPFFTPNQIALELRMILLTFEILWLHHQKLVFSPPSHCFNPFSI